MRLTMRCSWEMIAKCLALSTIITNRTTLGDVFIINFAEVAKDIKKFSKLIFIEEEKKQQSVKESSLKPIQKYSAFWKQILSTTQSQVSFLRSLLKWLKNFLSVKKWEIKTKQKNIFRRTKECWNETKIDRKNGEIKTGSVTN